MWCIRPCRTYSGWCLGDPIGFTSAVGCRDDFNWKPWTSKSQDISILKIWSEKNIQSKLPKKDFQAQLLAIVQSMSFFLLGKDISFNSLVSVDAELLKFVQLKARMALRSPLLLCQILEKYSRCELYTIWETVTWKSWKSWKKNNNIFLIGTSSNYVTAKFPYPWNCLPDGSRWYSFTKSCLFGMI